MPQAQWYDPQVHTGWRKNMPEKKRRQRVLEAHEGDLLSSAKSLQALANVTEDYETKRVARKDALYFFQKHSEQRAQTRYEKVGKQALRITPRMPKLA